MSDFLQRMKSAAKADKKTIVLPEGEDPRTIEAAKKIVEEGLANLVILGNPDEIQVEGVTVIDPRTAAEVARYDYGGAALQSVAPGRRQTALLLNVHGGNSLVTLSESLTVMSEIPARQAFAVSATDTDIYLLCPDAVECYGYDGVQNWVQTGLPSRPLAVLHGKQTLVFTGSQADVLAKPAE